MEDSARWQQIDSLLEQLLELPSGERADRLLTLCSDPSLRAEVADLLRADEEASDFLARPAAALLPELAHQGLDRTTQPASRTGLKVGHYQIREELGRGGMGEVYLAYDARLDRQVALKRLHSGLERMGKVARLRFRREARLCAGLDHPAIVRIHDLVEADGEDWLVMEHVQGSTLTETLARGPLTEEQLLPIARQIVAGLAAAHAAGVIHRDLKASNVLVTDDGQAKLLDFGLAKRIPSPNGATAAKVTVDTTITGRHQVMGTLASMSPEQARGEEVDHRSDLFSLGTLLYQALSGQAPFEHPEPAMTLTRVCTHQPTSLTELNPQVSPQTSALVERLLSKEAKERPESAQEVLDALPLADVSPRGHRWWRYRAGRKSARRAAATGLAALLMAVSAGFTLHTLLQGRKSPAAPPRYVAVAETEVVAPADEAETALLAAAVYAAAQHGLSRLAGLAAVNAAGLDSPTESPLALARALGAKEVLTTRLDCDADRCQLTLSRLAAADGQVLWLDSLLAHRNDFALLRGAVANRLREAYPGSTPRTSSPSTFPQQAYATYLQMLEAFHSGKETPGPELARRLAELRQTEPGFLEAYLLEAEVSREVFHASRQQAWLQRALIRLEEAAELAPSDPRVHSYLFDLAAESEQWQLAEEAHAAVKRLEPSGAAALQQEAELLAQRGQPAQALVAMSSAAQLQPSSNHLFNLALMEYREGHVAAARGTLERLLSRVPSSFKGRSFLSQLELLAGSPQRAVQLFEVLAQGNADAPTLANLSTAYLLASRFEDALSAAQRAHTLQPNNSILVLNLADALALSGQRDRAVALYRQARDMVRLDEDLPRWQQLTVEAQALAHLEQPREAAELVQEALRIAPHNPQVALESALVYTLTGDLNVAMVSIEKARQLGMGQHWFQLPWFSALANSPTFAALVGNGAAAAGTGRQDQ